jgi:hypothetical protein
VVENKCSYENDPAIKRRGRGAQSPAHWMIVNKLTTRFSGWIATCERRETNVDGSNCGSLGSRAWQQNVLRTYSSGAVHFASEGNSTLSRCSTSSLFREEQRLPANGVKQESPHCGLPAPFRAVIRNRYVNVRIHRARSTIKRFPDRQQTDIRGDDRDGTRERRTAHAVSRRRSDSCRASQRRCAVLQNCCRCMFPSGI